MNCPDVCLICKRQDLKEGGSPELVFQDERWTVRHSTETNILGYMLMESRRHFLDLSEATSLEQESYGKLLSSLVSSIKAVFSAERVYTFTLCELVPHFHVHLIPRTSALPRAYRGRGILAFPLQPACDQNLMAETCLSIRRRLRGCIDGISPINK